MEHVKKFVTVETARMGRHLISLPECELKLDDYRFYGEFFKCVRARYTNREDEKRKGEPQEVDLLVDDLVAKVEGSRNPEHGPDRQGELRDLGRPIPVV